MAKQYAITPKDHAQPLLSLMALLTKGHICVWFR